MNTPLVIDYYSDVLCVWAWIAQRRLDELTAAQGSKIEFHYYYVDIFGDVETKIATGWEERGGYSGFADHVQHAASHFDFATINPKIWTEVRPTTSANAHLILKAVECEFGMNKSIELALAFRSAFFVDALDISDLDVLLAIVKQNGLDTAAISTRLNNGTAMAALMHDYRQSQQQSVKGSPSYVMDGGRQTLYGNVGYRVLNANIEELLKKPSDEASWC
jgi:predicted DsbA family dithiol-disulfide isomerase